MTCFSNTILSVSNHSVIIFSQLSMAGATIVASYEEVQSGTCTDPCKQDGLSSYQR